MTCRGNSPLWKPYRGIRFASRLEDSVYPVLDFSRFPQVSPEKDNVVQSSDKRGTGNQYAAESMPSDATSPDVRCTKDDSTLQVEDLPERSIPEEQSEGVPRDVVEVVAPPSETQTVKESEAVPEDGQGVVELSLPPLTALDFNVSRESFDAARASSAGSAESFWSHAMYQRLDDDGTVHKVKVHYCTSKHTMEEVCKKHFQGEEVLGFDLEWNPFATRTSGPRANISLIQLASPSRIGLFHVALFSKDDFIAPTFREIMENPKISKVGVSIKGDCTRMKTFHGVETRGMFELSHLYKLVRYSREGRQKSINKTLVSLSTQVQDYLGLPMFKGQSVRSSNWTLPLDMKQIMYSAGDAYAGVQLYHVLEGERKKLHPVPPRPHHAELNLPIRIAVPPPDASATGNEQTDSKTERKPSDAGGSKVKSKTAASAELRARDARIVAAEMKMKQHRAQKKTQTSSTPAAIRAYYIWHENADLTPESIAKLLRDPPLQTHTVNLYILDAITVEKLPYCRARLKDEIVCLLHDRFSIGKYRDIISECRGS